MTTNQLGVETLYELALSISPADTVEATATRALSGYLDAVGSEAGAIFECVERADGTVRYRPVVMLPEGDRVGAMREAVNHLPENEPDAQFRERLPVEETDQNSGYVLMDLPDFGVLILVGGRIEDGLRSELVALNEKLADACRRNRIEAELREERNRFEAVFEAIREPVVNVVFEDGKPVVRRVNPSFERTFGYAESEAVGQNLDSLIAPEGDDQSREGSHARGGAGPEIRRQTASGEGHFLVRSATVDSAEDTLEQFELYVDITDEKSHQRRLERLYEEAMSILSATDSERVAERAVETAAEIVDISIGGIHLYDRTREALVPVATTTAAQTTLDGGPDTYTDHETVVWDVYQRGEAVVIDDIDAFDGTVPRRSTPINSAVILPLGDHGVFIASSTQRDAFDSTEVGMLRLFSTLVEIALDRCQREQGLEGIQEITRTALAADSHMAVAEAAMDRVPELLDFPLSAVWQYDHTAEVLRPLAATDQSRELFEELPVFDGSGSLAWQAYQSSKTLVVPDTSDSEILYNENTPIESEIAIPLGDFGVMVTGSTRPDSFAEPEQRLVETLAANLETAFRLIDRREELDLLDQVLARILRHNIRNELNLIQGYAAQILDVGDDQSTAMARKIMQRCHDLEATAEHAREMREIVRSREERTTVALRDTVEEAVSMICLDHPGAEVRTDYRGAPEVIAHPDLLTAIQHILKNAIQHYDGDNGAVVEVTVEETEEYARLDIEDNGPGIPRSEVEILDKHGESALEHGSGAGLWIVDRVVQYSGASIEYEQTDSGTLVRVEFEYAG